MNRAWMIRAEQRISQLEAAVRELKQRVAELEAPQPVAPVELVAAEPAKRGPGRPRKEAA